MLVFQYIWYPTQFNSPTQAVTEISVTDGFLHFVTSSWLLRLKSLHSCYVIKIDVSFFMLHSDFVITARINCKQQAVQLYTIMNINFSFLLPLFSAIINIHHEKNQWNRTCLTNHKHQLICYEKPPPPSSCYCCCCCNMTAQLTYYICDRLCKFSIL